MNWANILYSYFILLLGSRFYGIYPAFVYIFSFILLTQIYDHMARVVHLGKSLLFYHVSAIKQSVFMTEQSTKSEKMINNVVLNSTGS